MLRLLLERLPVGKKDVSAAHIEALLTLREGGMLDLPEGVTAWREKDVLLFCWLREQKENVRR